MRNIQREHTVGDDVALGEGFLSPDAPREYEEVVRYITSISEGRRMEPGGKLGRQRKPYTR